MTPLVVDPSGYLKPHAVGHCLELRERIDRQPPLVRTRDIEPPRPAEAPCEPADLHRSLTRSTRGRGTFAASTRRRQPDQQPKRTLQSPYDMLRLSGRS